MTTAAPIRVLELRSVLGTGGGPEKTILLGSAKSNEASFSVTVCYIRDARDRTFEMSSRAAELRVPYIEILERHSFDVRIWRELVGLVRDKRIDIVHSHDYKTDFLALLLGWRQGVIPLATVHGWIRNTFRERAYSVADKWLLARFPAVIAVSRPIRQALIDAGASPDRVHGIPNGIDHHFYRREPGTRARSRSALNLPPDAIVVGAVGRLEAEKRFDLLLRAVAASSLANAIVVLAGDGRSRSALMAQAQSDGLSQRVHWLGQRSDVREVLQALDVYVQTSDTEGIPNAVLEAMATEVPVVATDVGGTSELIEHGTHGLLVPRRDVDALVAAVRCTIDDPAATRRRVAAARQRVESELSFEARMQRVHDIYVRLCASTEQRV